jgi:hypothetical protein
LHEYTRMNGIFLQKRILHHRKNIDAYEMG